MLAIIEENMRWPTLRGDDKVVAVASAVAASMATVVHRGNAAAARRSRYMLYRHVSLLNAASNRGTKMSRIAACICNIMAAISCLVPSERASAAGAVPRRSKVIGIITRVPGA